MLFLVLLVIFLTLVLRFIQFGLHIIHFDLVEADSFLEALGLLLVSVSPLIAFLQLHPYLHFFLFMLLHAFPHVLFTLLQNAHLLVLFGHFNFFDIQSVLFLQFLFLGLKCFEVFFVVRFNYRRVFLNYLAAYVRLQLLN